MTDSLIAKSVAAPDSAHGGFVALDDGAYYRIEDFDRLAPFLVSLPGETDVWMFVSTAGGLTAGRVDAEGSLFPYETEDKLHRSATVTGPATLIRRAGGGHSWEPFQGAATSGVQRNLYKNDLGNRLIFEEVNPDQGLVFRYRWASCHEFGVVRTVTLTNTQSRTVTLELLDGLRNLMPHGVPLALSQQSSSLVDAYRRTDLGPAHRMALYSLTSRISDRAEAVASLRANVAWSTGLPDATVHLREGAWADRLAGRGLIHEQTTMGVRGNYWLSASVDVAPGETIRWHQILDVGLLPEDVVALCSRIDDHPNPVELVDNALVESTATLHGIVDAADAAQLTDSALVDTHHLANVLFNGMRGGVFADQHRVEREDFRKFVSVRNRPAADRGAAFLDALPEYLETGDLVRRARENGDVDLERLAMEYLPLYFGRRHGDPSRPWNRFSIRVQAEDGSRALHYEGNWRDIFQNWEALAVSYPAFLPGMIATFVNASTIDGFNPYRITRDGVDWEEEDADDPWSNIGYWGDHQIVYLLRLLEAQERVDPELLAGLMQRDMFSFADVPYRIRPYADLLADPRNTIEFDNQRSAAIREREVGLGTDGRRVLDTDGTVHHVTLAEKLLIPALSKLSNFVPDAGIWLNTQRPEWNDANNALVGDGVSVVTLCYLHRYLLFLESILVDQADAHCVLSTEVVRWLRGLEQPYGAEPPETVSPRERRRWMDAVGEPFSDYRRSVYQRGFTGRESVEGPRIVRFLRNARAHVMRSIRVNRTESGLYHSYRLLDRRGSNGDVAVRDLYPMLEGQVAVLSSGLVEPAEALTMVETLFRSDLYTERERTFLLYPERTLPAFLDRTAIPSGAADGVPLVNALLDQGHTGLVLRDAEGTLRFHGDLVDEASLLARLDELAGSPQWAHQVTADGDALLDLYDEVFQLRQFTGRSGAMVGYEGLGCVYWHMVAKLLLAVQEQVQRAAETADASLDGLRAAYFRIRAGLGYQKSVAEYGAFPTDPYSHTPAAGGARQPGMTGQVKEEILTRFGELGVRIAAGRVSFRPVLLRRDEFLQLPGILEVSSPDQERHQVAVPEGGLAFTLCQVPVVYQISDTGPWVRVTRRDGEGETLHGRTLSLEDSRALLARGGEVLRVDVALAPEDPLPSA